MKYNLFHRIHAKLIELENANSPLIEVSHEKDQTHIRFKENADVLISSACANDAEFLTPPLMTLPSASGRRVKMWAKPFDQDTNVLDLIQNHATVFTDFASKAFCFSLAHII